jgi:hypothetical protein
MTLSVAENGFAAGLTPLLASVAAMTARSRAVTRTEHCRK